MAKNPTGTVSNGGELDSDPTEEMNNIGHVPFNKAKMALQIHLA